MNLQPTSITNDKLFAHFCLGTIVIVPVPF